MTDYDIIDVSAENVERAGFFCYMSKRKEPGYRQKREWLEARFAEGMKLKILHEQGGRDTAFVEYLPGEAAWRAVYAPGYLVIHCLWVVGRGKGKGYGTRLLQECIADARAQSKHGVVMVSSDGNWLASKKLFLHNGFEEIDQAPPSFQLLVHRFSQGPLPAFPQDWEFRQAAFGRGITVIRTPQCPYIENASRDVLGFAAEMGIPARTVTLRSAREVQDSAPCAYGVFSMVLDGKLFSYVYLNREDFTKRLAQIGG